MLKEQLAQLAFWTMVTSYILSLRANNDFATVPLVKLGGYLMRILNLEEMAAVSGGGGGLDSPGKSDAGYGRNTDFGPSRGPQTRGGRRNDGRNAAMDSYLGKDVYGANSVGVSGSVVSGAVGGAIGGAAGGVLGVGLGALGGAVTGGLQGGWTSPSPSNKGGRSGGGRDSRADGGSRGGGQ
ncbi:hypothetical protein [Brucella anthropi]|uniref:hypothetical protein n=1 Tax=Brucella anthropi TaxID=529 RepID=UPI0016395E4E|nr:hypothetical protein [Brucella anthropi]